MNEREIEYQEMCIGCILQDKCDYLLKKPKCYTMLKKKIETLENKILASELDKNNLFNNMENECQSK